MSRRQAKKVRDISPQDFPSGGKKKEKIEFLLQYAVLAPSTHNIQPWLFKIKENSCEIHVNPDLHLPEGDATKRNAYISLGCSLENLIVAAKYFGMYDKHVYHIDKDHNKAVEVFFHEDQQDLVDDLEDFLEAIKNRVNVRGMFLQESLDEEILSSFLELNQDYRAQGHFITDKKKIKEIANLTALGMKHAHGKKSFRKEMSKLINHNLSRKIYGIHGYSMKMPTPLSFFLPKMIRFFNLGFVLGKLNYKSVSSAPMVCVISSPKEDPEFWLEVGRLAQMFMLKAKLSNLKTSIYVAAIEMGGELLEELKNVLQTDNIPQFLICTGKMKGSHKLTPRWSVEEKLV